MSETASLDPSTPTPVWLPDIDELFRAVDQELEATQLALRAGLAAAQAIGAERDRAQALAALAPHLTGEARDLALRAGLAAAQAIGDERDRAQALAALAPHLTGEARYLVTEPLESAQDADLAAPYVRAAAVLNTFDAWSIRPLKGARPPSIEVGALSSTDLLHLLLGCSMLVVSSQEKVRWSLRDPVRRMALAELLAAGQVQQAIDANPEMARDLHDPVQRMLIAVLTQSLLPLEKLRLDDLTALQRVAPWVDALEPQVSLPPAHEIRLYLEREQLLESFRSLIGRWEDGVFVEHFRGRRRELRRLRGYVDVTISESFGESASRAIKGAVGSLFNLLERPPLVIHGPGGVGKSTLMAKFLLQHAEAYEQERYPFVYVDFDRPDIRPGDPRTILAEAARQLGVQYPKAEEALHEFRHRIQGETTQSTDYSATSYIADLARVYAQYMEPDRPFVLVLDTFEVVQQQSRDYVKSLFGFLDTLQGVFRRLRTVLVGRAPVTQAEVGVPVENLSLPDLDEEAARGFLQSRGITDAQVATEIIGLVGRQPLALKLAADLVQQSDISEVREAAGGTSVMAWLRRTWAQTDIAGRLYQRLLNHVVDPEVRKLAHPGLVLRRITPEIIRLVLAKPCEVAVKDTAAAQDLFERLRQQVSLVAPAESGVLRHRTDVRQMMLPLILEDKSKSKQTQLIQKQAIHYYANLTGTVSRAEEIYHRLLLGESPRSVEQRWISGLGEHLRASLDELPPHAQAFVAARIAEERPGSVWQAADLEDWEIYAERRARNLLNLQKPDEAQEVLQQRTQRSSTSRLLGLEAIVLQAQGRTDAARTSAQQALEVYRKADTHSDLVDELRPLLAG